MKVRSASTLFYLSWFLATAVMSAVPAVSDYAGQYVLKLGTRNFFVLSLRQTGELVGGRFHDPFHSSLGTSLSIISPDVIVEAVVSAAIDGNHLHLTVKNPLDPSDTDSYNLTLLDHRSASLQLEGVPIDPWTLARLPLLPLFS